MNSACLGCAEKLILLLDTFTFYTSCRYNCRDACGYNNYFIIEKKATDNKDIMTLISIENVFVSR